MNDEARSGPSRGGGFEPPGRLYSPEEIAERLGGMAVKSLAELIRKTGVETVTMGHAEPSRKGGRRKRIWGMTGAQLRTLLEKRARKGSGTQT